MPSSLYVALSAQVALERRLNTVANNMANMSTAGFRAEEVKFETLLSRAGNEGVAFASRGETFISRRTGPVTATGNPLDVAIEGEAWFAFATPDGAIYSRDGRLQMTEAGELQTVDGYAILDVGGAALRLDPDAGPPRISGDGMITQGDTQVGALGLFSIPEGARLNRYGSSGVIPEDPAVAVQDLNANGVRQGFIEGSNINPILEMTKLIMLSRTFDSAASAVAESEGTIQRAIRTIGGD
jgi:flagellar basal-body rod protein FlgF